VRIHFIIMPFLALLLISGCNLDRRSTAVTIVKEDGSKTIISNDGDTINIKRVYPSNPIVAINGSIHLTAIVTDPYGEYLQSTVDNPVTVTWTSSDPTIASVNQNGTVVGKRSGSVTISLKAEYNNYVSSVYTTTVNVVSLNNDVAEIYLSPDRAYVDVNGERTFKLTAVDYYGAQTSISPGTVTFEVSDTQVASITPESIASTDEKIVTVTGLQKGYVFITPIYTVTNATTGVSIKITGSPLVLQVKDATESSKPQDDTVDAGNYLSMAVQDIEGKKIVHVVHYDQGSDDLMYSFFDGSWQSETVVTTAGKASRLVLSPFSINEGRPFLFFLEDNLPKLWFMTENSNDWLDSTIISSVSSTDIFDDDNPYTDGEKVLDMSAFEGSGTISPKLHLLYYDAVKQRIIQSTSTITSTTWFSWGNTYYFELTQQLQSLSIAHNHLSGDARFAYNVLDTNATEDDGGVYYASVSSGVVRHELIPNTNGDEQDVVLKLDSNNVPSIVWHTDSEVTIVTRVSQSGEFTWTSKNIAIEPRPTQIDSVDFSFDAYNSPRIIFNADGKIKYARRVSSTSGLDNWIVESPEDSDTATLGAYSSIAVDSENRAHLVYTSGDDQWFNYWTEPNFFDYRLFPDLQDIQADIIGE